jgi:small nuclear ribonucleoprotein (snRNP)-like protein
MALLVAATMTLAPAPVMAAAQEGSAGRTEPSASIFRVDPAFRLDSPAIDERWTRLGRLSSKATVTVDLRDGRVLEGTIHAVRTESLDFVASRDEISVKIADIRSSTGGLSRGQSVVLHLRDGRTISGTVVEADSDSLSLFKAGSVLQLAPQEIQRIRQSVRWKMKFLGAAIGAVAGIAVDVSRRDSDAPPAAGIMLGVAGCYVAPLIRSEKTLWEHPTRRP